MLRLVSCACLISSLLMASACTQAPAQIDLRGQNSYGRNGSYANAGPLSKNDTSYHTGQSSYIEPAYSTAAPVAPVSQSNDQRVTTQSVGSSDLPPLTPVRNDHGAANDQAAAKPAIAASNNTGTPFGRATPPAQEAPKDTAPKNMASNDVQPVNPWTHKARFSDNAVADKPDSAKINAADSPPAANTQTAAVAQLDSVVANDGQKAKPPVKATATSGGFMWPVSGHKIISGFGPKGGGKVNDGINIASAEGEPVWASADGEVVYVGNELQGYGNMVVIKHAGTKSTSYAHLSKATVDKYDRVKQGDIIGYVGSTGNVKEPQLHFAIRDGKEPVDPQKYLNSKVAGL